MASRLSNLAGQGSTDWHWRQLCGSEFSLSAPPIEALLNQPACRQSCDRAFGAWCLGSKSIQADIAAELALASSGMRKQARHRRFRVSNFAQTPSRRASRAVEKLLGSNLGDSNAANFVRSTKVRIFRYDSRNPDRYDGIVLGFSPHLDNLVNDWSGSNIATRLSSKSEQFRRRESDQPSVCRQLGIPVSQDELVRQIWLDGNIPSL